METEHEVKQMNLPEICKLETNIRIEKLVAIR